MDNRDRYLLNHHRRRLQVASRYPLERQLKDAQRQLTIALHQGRLAYSVLITGWLGELEKRYDQ